MIPVLPSLSQDQTEPMARYLGHVLRNAMTPLTVRMDVVREAMTAEIPPTPGEIVRLVEEVAAVNQRIETLIAEVRRGSR